MLRFGYTYFVINVLEVLLSAFGTRADGLGFELDVGATRLQVVQMWASLVHASEQKRHAKRSALFESVEEHFIN